MPSFFELTSTPRLILISEARQQIEPGKERFDENLQQINDLAMIARSRKFEKSWCTSKVGTSLQ